MSDWVLKPLGELISLQRGHDLPSQDRVAGSVPIMGSSGITGFHNKAKISGPGVVVGRSGNSMGEVSFSSEDYWPLNTCLYITDFKGNDVRYIYYLLKTINFDQFNSGSAQKSLNRNAVYPYEVKTTTCKEEQERIRRVLANLEDKIELNRQTNQTLEHIAQAIFKSWFVDFEPTRAKIAAIENGQDPERAAMCAISGKSSDELALLGAEQIEQLKATAALFPEVLVKSELGEIPEGWSEKTINDLSTTVAMGPFGSNIKVDTFVEQGIPIINGQQLRGIMLTDSDNNFITPEHADRLSKSNVFRGDIVITHRGTLGQVSIVTEGSQYDRYIASQSQCFIRPNRELISPVFLAFYFHSYIGQHELFSYKSQVGVPAIAKPVTNLKKIELVTPSKVISDQFEKVVTSLQAKMTKNIEESSSLGSIRDTLLPKLLSGELTPYSNAAKFIKSDMLNNTPATAEASPQ
ncbi:restriction endonuclease subunit S [Endozoicomonas numazuensis]|uniref:restriction endonuclease subunit S n=1 Tax=Endozoicomonas numazuensis TaxID=1137799 RepID=UPI000691431F|nr:restriction endonuclease subunit S [Endozoicomonas numazuensis]